MLLKTITAALVLAGTIANANSMEHLTATQIMALSAANASGSTQYQQRTIHSYRYSMPSAMRDRIATARRQMQRFGIPMGIQFQRLSDRLDENRQLWHPVNRRVRLCPDPCVTIGRWTLYEKVQIGDVNNYNDDQSYQDPDGEWTTGQNPDAR